VGKLSSGENRERVDGPISLEVKYLGGVGDFRLASPPFLLYGQRKKRQRGRKRGREREGERERERESRRRRYEITGREP